MDVCAYLENAHGIVFNAQQKEAVLAGEGNILLLAVPGSGKTTVLVSRIAHLIHERGVPPEAILTITYNRETARDMKRRYQALFGGLGGRLPAFATIHSFSLSVMRAYARLKSRAMPRLIDAEGEGLRTRLLRELYRRHAGEFLAEDGLETLSTALSYVKNAMLSPGAMTEERCGVKSFPEIYADYEAYKRQNRLIDFDDMLTMALDIFGKFPAVLERFRAQFRYINVDEAQDTSLLQHRLIERMAGGAAVFMVGDEDQSIYSFRGACPEALLSFGERYENAVVLKMEENFRSGGEIVRRADAFIRQNKQRYEKTMFCRSSRAGAVDVIPLEDYADQYRQAARILSDLPQGKTAAVLYRNNESAIPMIDLFYQSGTPFYIREHRLTYFTSGVLRDLPAYILLAADQRDLDSFGQIYYKLGYSRGVWEYAREHIREYDSVFDCILSMSSLPAYRKGQARRYREGFAALFRLKPPAAVDYILAELNYGDYLENRVANSSARVSAYQKLNTAKCLGQGVGSVFLFLDRLEGLEKSIRERKQVDPQAAVTLSTLHSSKGMEFDVVILLDMLENILPSSAAADDRRMGEPGGYENEVRLFYVGATRARERLVLFRSYLLNGTDAPPSVFLRDFLEGPREEAAKKRAARPSK